jgi:hypothetical protein
MSENGDPKAPLPIVPFLHIPDDGGRPYLAGSRCGECQAVFTGERTTCSKCGSRDRMQSIRLAERGELYVYSITYRSFPGVETPFVSAVVDLDGGGTLKGTLKNVEPDPEKIRMGMPVEVIYEIAPRKDRDGNEYLTYTFQPVSP